MRVLLHSGGLLLRPEGLREIADFVGGRSRVALVTAASMHDEAATFARLHAFLSPPPPSGAGLDLLHLRWNDRPLETLARAEGLFMGGGNTYALLKRLRESGLLPAIRERVLGPEHPNTAASLNNLAALYNRQGKYKQAEPLYQRALAICERMLGPEHPSTAQSLNNLATLYYAQGKYTEAEPLFKRALTISEQHLGQDHPDTTTLRNNYALLLQEMQKRS